MDVTTKVFLRLRVGRLHFTTKGIVFIVQVSLARHQELLHAIIVKTVNREQNNGYIETRPKGAVFLGPGYECGMHTGRILCHLYCTTVWLLSYSMQLHAGVAYPRHSRQRLAHGRAPRLRFPRCLMMQVHTSQNPAVRPFHTSPAHM